MTKKWDLAKKYIDFQIYHVEPARHCLKPKVEPRKRRNKKLIKCACKWGATNISYFAKESKFGQIHLIANILKKN